MTTTANQMFDRILIAAAIMLAFTDPAGAAEYRPVVGEPHADFVLPNIETREAVALSEFRGKKTILIHFASW